MRLSPHTLLAGVCLFALSASATAGDIYKIDPVRSRIGFQVGNVFGAVKGRFTKFSGTIEVDREHPESSSVQVTIQTSSIDTGNAKRDQHLRTADFFDTVKFPEMTFKSQRVKKTANNAGDVNGELSMHGITRPMSLHVQLLGNPDSIGKSATTRWRVATEPIKRAEFRIGQGGGAGMIGKEVKVEIEIEASKAQ